MPAGDKVGRNLVEWLLDANQPAVRYRALTDLCGRSEGDSEVREAKAAVGQRGWGARILSDQRPDGRWQSRPKGSLYGPKYLATNWRAIVLSDFGLTKADPRVEKTAELFFAEWLPPGVDWTTDAEVCVVGNLARYLTRFGYGSDPRVKALFTWMVGAQKDDGGWHCFESDKGTLDCWEGLAAYAALPTRLWTRGIKRSAERGAEFYLERHLVDEGKPYEPWLRFHYPNHYYYDVLVGLDVLTSLGYGDDRRLRQALDLMKSKRRPDGSWALDASHPDIGAGSLYSLRKRAKPFVVERPGAPSKIATLTCLRILKRVPG